MGQQIGLDFEPVNQRIRKLTDDYIKLRLMNQGGAGCDKNCPGKVDCLIGWPDGSCGAKPQGTQWPEQLPIVVENKDDEKDPGNRTQEGQG